MEGLEENKISECENWLLRISDGVHFNASSRYSIWGINSKTGSSKYFIENVRKGDKLWFVKSNSNGLIVAVATYTGLQERINGPLFDITRTNEELGWTKQKGDWDYEIHYKDLYNLTHCNLESKIKSPVGIRRYNTNCKVNLVTEYPHIVRYSKVITSM